MKKLSALIALLLASLMIISCFAFSALAEGEEAPGGEESSGGTENSGTEPSETYTVNIDFKGAGAESASVYFNDQLCSSSSYTGTIGEPLSIKVVPNSGYTMSATPTFGVSDFSSDLQSDGNGAFVYTFSNATVGKTYVLKIDAELIPVPAKVEVWAKDDSLNTVPFDVKVGVSQITDITNNTFSCQTGDKVTITFNIDGFDASNAFLKINGDSADFEGNSCVFTVKGDTKVEFGYGIVPVRFEFINGPATVELKDNSTGASKGNITSNSTVHFKKGSAYDITVRPGAGRLFENDIVFEGCESSGDNGVYTITANGEAKVIVTLKTDTTLPTGVKVTVTAGENGSVSAAGVTANGNTVTANGVSIGDDIVVKATPDEGYVVDQFLVNGTPVIFMDNVYTITNISANASIKVTFKKGEASKPVGVDDINWDAQTIIIDIRGGRKIDPEVFRKIGASATDGKTVAFQSELGTVSVPMGTQFAGDFEQADLRIKLVTNLEILNKIKKAVSDETGANIKYNAYSLDFGIELPKGTGLSFNLGSAFADSDIDVLEFLETPNANGKSFEYKGGIKTGSTGVSTDHAYTNESILICAKALEETTFTISSSVVNNVGGTINPLGNNPVKLDSSCSYFINANSGFVIKQVLVDGKSVEGVSGLKSYVHEFKNIGANHTISVEFRVDANSGDDDSGDKSNGGTVVAVLVIVFVALAGAAALFLVKWRQEKF